MIAHGADILTAMTHPETRPGLRGLRHVAMRVRDLPRMQGFYESVFGMRVVWQPDANSVYLSSGIDNLALHQIPGPDKELYAHGSGQVLDHFGFIVDTPESVDRLFDQVSGQIEALGGKILHKPKRHRDNSYSFYLADPDGNTVQILFEPMVSPKV